MSRFKTREDLFNFVINSWQTPEWYDEWKEWIFSLCVDGKDFKEPLYHLSTTKNLIKEWSDTHSPISGGLQPPHVIYAEWFPEGRLSTSTTIEGCYYGAYSSIDTAHHKSKKDYIDVYIYEVDPTGCKVLPTEKLTNEWLVHDAHVSKEVSVFGRPKLTLVKILRLKDTRDAPDNECVHYRPFNCDKYKERWFHTPMVVLQETDL